MECTQARQHGHHPFGQDVPRRHALAQVDQQVQLPAGYSLKWGGQFENLKQAEQRLGLVIPVVFVLIGILLFMALVNS